MSVRNKTTKTKLSRLGAILLSAIKRAGSYFTSASCNSESGAGLSHLLLRKTAAESPQPASP